MQKRQLNPNFGAPKKTRFEDLLTRPPFLGLLEDGIGFPWYSPAKVWTPLFPNQLVFDLDKPRDLMSSFMQADAYPYYMVRMDAYLTPKCGFVSHFLTASFHFPKFEFFSFSQVRKI